MSKYGIMEHYNQLVVWPGTIVGDSNEQLKFQTWLDEEGFRAKYVTEFKTLPDSPGDIHTGGRNDLLFYIHEDDVGKFAIWRLQYEMRWWEDYLDNGGSEIVPPEVLQEFQYGWGEKDSTFN